jgi:anhydro-N-acetylmuramic acid kinase
MRALGLMSGTSLDGIDAALIVTDGESVAAFEAWSTTPYGPALRERLRAALGRRDAPAGLARELTEAHAAAVAALLADAKLEPADVGVIGFHGHTLAHRPDQRFTLQIGDGQLLARLTGIDVVADFRARDVAAGGQGAPLAPLYHRALARELPKPLAVLNIGGVANVTYLGSEGVLAFDVGPGNALIDDWVRRHTGQAYDRDGQLAATGRIAEDVLAAMLDQPWFDLAPPKSLDRNDFSLLPASGLGAADGAATLTEFTAAAVVRALGHLPEKPWRWLVGGGGRHNRALMAALARRLEAPAGAVAPVEAVGWRGDALEAEAFAYLAVRSLKGLPLSLPATTGVPSPQTGGELFPAEKP